MVLSLLVRVRQNVVRRKSCVLFLKFPCATRNAGAGCGGGCELGRSRKKEHDAMRSVPLCRLLLLAHIRRAFLVVLIGTTSQVAPTFGQTPTGVIDTVIGGNNGDGQAASNAIIDPLGMEARGQPT